MAKNIKLTERSGLSLRRLLNFFNSLLTTKSEKDCNSEFLPEEIQGLNVVYTTLTSNFVSTCHLGVLKAYSFSHTYYKYTIYTWKNIQLDAFAVISCCWYFVGGFLIWIFFPSQGAVLNEKN